MRLIEEAKGPSMKISDSNLNAVSTARNTSVEQAGTGGGARGVSGKGADNRDRVQLSSLSGALSALAPGSAERQLRVEELEGVVQSGSYNVDASAVSGSLVNDAMLG